MEMADVEVLSSANEELVGGNRVEPGNISDGELPADDAGKVNEREKERRAKDERSRSRRYEDRDRERDRDRDRRRHRSRDDDRRRRDYHHHHRSESRRTDDSYRRRRRSRGRSDEEREERRDNNRDKKGEAENLNPNRDEEIKKKDDNDGEPEAKKTRRKDGPQEDVTTRTGGAYIPPAKLRMMQEQINDKTSVAFQRLAWEALKKSLNGLINKVSVTNVAIISVELFKENIVRGRGLLARSLMQAQAASPTFSNVYACLVSIINSKFPQIGALLLRRLIIQFRRGFRRNDKSICLSATRFIAHLVNQQVAHEIVALEILTLFLENPTDDSVEVAIGFLKECGAKLAEVTPRGMNAIFDRLRGIVNESQLEKRVQYMIDVMFAIRKDGFKDHPVMIEGLNQVEETDQYTHSIALDTATDPEDLLNVFKPDPNFEISEEKYQAIKSAILEANSSDDESGDEEEGGGGSGTGSEDDDDEEEKTITDNTETDLTTLRRTIYLTIQSSLDFEECAHKLLKMALKPGQEVELCHMILDCCAQQRTYEKFYGLLGSRFCQINKVYVDPFEQIFCDSYDTIHRLETNKLRNVAKFFAHLLFTDAISWMVLGHIKLNEEDTTSSNRIFIKILFQELSEYMGLPKLNARIKDPTLDEGFAGLFPRDNPRNTRFAINFFTSIGLGGLTDELREHIKVQPKRTDAGADSDDSSSSSSSE